MFYDQDSAADLKQRLTKRLTDLVRSQLRADHSADFDVRPRDGRYYSDNDLLATIFVGRDDHDVDVRVSAKGEEAGLSCAAIYAQAIAYKKEWRL